MKKHNTLKVVLLSIFVVVLCSWIFPAAQYSGELVTQAREQIGLFNLFSYPLVTLAYFSYILFYVLVCGGLYGVLGKIPAYKKLLEKIVKGFKEKEAIFLALIMILLSAITSLVGFSFGLIILFPMLISIILMMGYNKLVAASVTVGSVICGMIGNTYANDTFSYINSILGTNLTDNLMYKGIILGLAVLLLIFNVLRYAKKSKTNVVEKDALIPEDVKVVKGKKVRVWPLVIIFDLMLIVLLLGVFPWSTIFPKFDWFTKALNWVQTYELFGFPIFAKLLGDVSLFGEWSYMLGSVPSAAIPTLVLITTVILGLVYRVKFDDFLDGIINGMKKALGPAVIMTMLSLILIISTYHPFQLYITNWLLGFGEGLNVVIMSLVAMFSSFVNVDALYVAQSTLPYVTSIFTDSALYPLIAIIFQSIYGLSMLVLPSSIILMGTLSYLDISYGKWLKHIWKLFIEILIVLLIVFIIILA